MNNQTCCKELKKLKKQLDMLIIADGQKNLESKNTYQKEKYQLKINEIKNELITNYNFGATQAQKVARSMVNSNYKYSADNYVKATGELKKRYHFRIAQKSQKPWYIA
jgi:hypothetical protein